jgi:hypothetical protein
MHYSFIAFEQFKYSLYTMKLATDILCYPHPTPLLSPPLFIEKSHSFHMKSYFASLYHIISTIRVLYALLYLLQYWTGTQEVSYSDTYHGLCIVVKTLLLYIG